MCRYGQSLIYGANSAGKSSVLHALALAHHAIETGDLDITSASDEFLDPLFATYFKKLGLPNLMAKKNLYELAEYVPESEIDPEIREKLDAIARVAESATPVGDQD